MMNTRTLKWILKNYITNSKNGFLLLRNVIGKRKHLVVTIDTDIVIEGYPRSGNTYCVALLTHLAENNLSFARHTHEIGQLKLAKKLNRTALVVIRPPLETVASLVVREGLDIAYALNFYIKYHDYVYSNSSFFTIVNFSSLINNPGAVCKLINNLNPSCKFRTYLKEHENNIREIVISMEKQDSGGVVRDTHVSIPSMSRSDKNKEILAIIEKRYSKELKLAQVSFEKLSKKGQPMKCLFAHNTYKIKGGEDNVFKSETKLLKNNKINIQTVIYDNEKITGFPEKVSTLLGSINSQKSYNDIRSILINGEFDLVHVHNYFPLISPSIFYACQSTKTPVIHTLHNFRALCPTATLSLNDKVCEKSINSNCFWTIPKRVYRHSFIGTAALAYMVEYHKHKGTWQTQVDRYIALTEFAKRKFIEGGFPAEKISVKPNFIIDPHHGTQKIEKQGGYALFVGRLSEEKGLDSLLEAWKNLNYPLKIVGDGPLKEKVARQSGNNPNIEFLGLQNKEIIFPLMQNADFLIMASTWYEGFPMVLLEAFANGTPALVSNIGGMAEIVRDGITGLHFEVGNPLALAGKAEHLIQHSMEARQMGENARQEYLEKFTPEINLGMLLDIYRQTIRDKKGSCPF